MAEPIYDVAVCRRQVTVLRERADETDRRLRIWERRLAEAMLAEDSDCPHCGRPESTHVGGVYCPPPAPDPLDGGQGA